MTRDTRSRPEAPEPRTDPPMMALICPTCGASASLPFEMTCRDHRPRMIEVDERGNPIPTEVSDG